MDFGFRLKLLAFTVTKNSCRKSYDTRVYFTMCSYSNKTQKKCKAHKSIKIGTFMSLYTIRTHTHTHAHTQSSKVYWNYAFDLCVILTWRGVQENDLKPNKKH